MRALCNNLEQLQLFMANTMQSTRVWDLPVRVCHWLIVGLFIAQWASAEWLDTKIELHAKIGYVFIAVVIFRIIWGFLGTYYARFKTFLYRPSRIVRYARNIFKPSAPVYLSHNPLGGVMVILLLFLLLLQGISGLFMTDDIFFDAPYHHSIPSSIQALISSVHHYTFFVLKILIALHILAVFLYVVVKKQALITAMVTGKKRTPIDESTHPTQLKYYWLRCLAIACIVAITVYMVVVVWAPKPEALW
jgi:cytochrome b